MLFKCVSQIAVQRSFPRIWIPQLVNLSMTIPAMIAIGINPMMYPPVGPASFASPPVDPKYRKPYQSEQQVDQVT